MVHTRPSPVQLLDAELQPLGLLVKGLAQFLIVVFRHELATAISEHVVVNSRVVHNGCELRACLTLIGASILFEVTFCDVFHLQQVPHFWLHLPRNPDTCCTGHDSINRAPK